MKNKTVMRKECDASMGSSRDGSLGRDVEWYIAFAHSLYE